MVEKATAIYMPETITHHYCTSKMHSAESEASRPMNPIVKFHQLSNIEEGQHTFSKDSETSDVSNTYLPIPLLSSNFVMMYVL